MPEFFVALLLAAFFLFYWIRSRRLQYYSKLELHYQAEIAPRQREFSVVTGREPVDFSARIARRERAVGQHAFATLAKEIEALVTTERSYLPSHKKGGTVAYETLCVEAPSVVAFYQSPELRALVSRAVGSAVVPTPLHDQSSCSVLFYELAGDHIDWHYDHNFYRGRHFTALLPIVNRGEQRNGLSSAKLLAKLDGQGVVFETHPNSLIVFEGARVLHKVTPICEGERRIILSMTFTEDPTNAWYQGIARRIKDTAFFGIRALWT